MSSRRIPALGVKDDSGSYVRAQVSPPPPPPPTPPIEAEVSLDDVHQRLLLVLDRETKRLTIQAAMDLLSKDQGIAFERCVKVLREFKKEERDYLEALHKLKSQEPNNE